MTHFARLSALTLLLFVSGCGFEPSFATGVSGNEEVDSRESGYSRLNWDEIEEFTSPECEVDSDCVAGASCFSPRCDLGICFLNPIMDCGADEADVGTGEGDGGQGDGEGSPSGDGDGATGGDGDAAGDGDSEGGVIDVVEDLLDGDLGVDNGTIQVEGWLAEDGGMLSGDVSILDGDETSGFGVDADGVLGSTGEQDDSIVGAYGAVTGPDGDAIVEVDASVDSDGSDLDVDGGVTVDSDPIVDSSTVVEVDLEVDLEGTTGDGMSGESMACSSSMDCGDGLGCTVDICLQSQNMCLHAMVDGCAASDEGAITILDDAELCHSPLDCVDDDGCSLDICVEPLGLCAHVQADSCSLDDPLDGFDESLRIVDDGLETVFGTKDHLVSVMCSEEES